MPKAAEVINYLQNEGTLAMAHLEGPDVSLKLCPKGRQQRLLSERPRASEFTGNYDLLCPWQVIPCVTSTSEDRSLEHHCSVTYPDAAKHNTQAREGHHTSYSVLIKELRHDKETQDNTAYPKKALVTCELI